MRPPTRPLVVVFVCTGNRARSPLAEALFRHRVESVPAEVWSAGTLEIGSLPALADAIESGRRIGVDLTEHRSRSLERVDLSQADLVVGFEPHHVSAAITRGGADARKTFLFGELVACLRDAPLEAGTPEEARAAIATVAAHGAPVTGTAALIVEDPLGKGASVMDRTATEIDGLVRELVAGLFGNAADRDTTRKGVSTESHD